MPHPLFPLRVGIMGCPVRPDVAWSAENLDVLKALGFNTMQLNIAWGARPGDEPLNLEDVIELPEAMRHLESDYCVPSGADPSPARRAQRKAQLSERIRLCRAAGMRTIFHFGAPNNGWYHPGFLEYMRGQMPRCLLDGKTQEYYIALLETFAAAYPGVDDVLMYTYDQAAWLCDEFGACPHCAGVPVHERVTPFINRMAETWQRLSPGGRLWWEPWELSAGQVLKCVEQLDPACVGLSLHTDVAEAQATVYTDRWFKNTAALAKQRGMPVLGENYLGAASEELEPYSHLAHPLVPVRMLRAVSQVRGVTGIKEYYGLLPDQEDPNLRAVGMYLADPQISDEDLLARLSAPYGEQAQAMARFWALTSEGMELFPWDASWFIREIGRSEPAHTLSAAFLRGYCAETPSWLSTRDAIFMKVNNAEPHPWMLEDVQLRCELAAGRFQSALEIGRSSLPALAPARTAAFCQTLDELSGLLTRTRAYAYHIRASNLAAILRNLRAAGSPAPERLVEELRGVLLADQANMGAPEPLEAAIRLLEENPDGFLATYFCVEEDKASKGVFSLTSR
jgi:hypothetical protein